MKNYINHPSLDLRMTVLKDGRKNFVIGVKHRP